MAPQAKLTPLQETEARRIAEQEARANKVPKTYSDEEKAARKERVAKAKDAMSRSVGLKGAHVAPAARRHQEVPAEPERPEAAGRRPVRSAHRSAVQGAAEEEDQRPLLSRLSGRGTVAATASPRRPAPSRSWSTRS